MRIWQTTNWIADTGISSKVNAVYQYNLFDMDQIELLAPAKDLETGVAAINCGADAVYIGPPQFGAREAAGNSLDTIGKLCTYAHRYWAKVYVTVNTLLYDEELSQAESLIKQLHELSVDAVIFQDFGLLELDLPPIPLFASTQTHNHTPERISFLEKIGIQRVILARELSLPQIQAIRSATTIELETFIHGALCVSFSGQCYLSYAIGGRSGNRGQCAQPCRRPYELIDGKGRTLRSGQHLLSLRDLNLSQHIGELVDAGVCSFKIEGRLKDKAYVMNVVGHYRKLLDNVLQDRNKRASSSGKPILDFSPDPQKTFNRGFTTYFINGRQNPIAAPLSPKSLGEPLGTVVAAGRDHIMLDKSAPQISPGDGLCFISSAGELCGTNVNRVVDGRIFPDKMQFLKPGAQIFRNHNHTFLASLSKSEAQRRIHLLFRLSTTADEVCLEAIDEDKNQATSCVTYNPQPAIKPEQAIQTMRRQLEKLGESIFACSRFECDAQPIPFLPVSVLNNLRRSVVDELSRIRLENHPRKMTGIQKNEEAFPVQSMDFQGNVLNKKAVDFYHRHGVVQIELAAESGLDLTGRKVMTTKLCLRYELNSCPLQPDARPVEEPLTLIDEQGTEYPLKFDCAACQMEVYHRHLPNEHQDS